MRTSNRYIVLVIFLLIVFSLFIYNFYYSKDDLCQEEVFVVSRGDNFLQVSEKLHQRKLIKSPIYFQAYLLITGNHRNLKAGSYLINSCSSIAEISQKIIQGKIAQKRFTIIEGWNTTQIAEYLSELDLIDYDKFVNLSGNSDNFKEYFDFIKDIPEKSSLEGYLFPDTYFIPLDATEEEIIKIVLSNFELKTKERRDEYQGSFFDIIIVASLIEKEVQSYQDKGIVSGIIQKRMEIGMPLQIDATISYITGKRTTRISISETQIDSPYNTYRYKGLPIGPIANPGIESIKAALEPIESDYLFYLSKPDGETVFSRNLEEHNIAKNRYLR